MDIHEEEAFARAAYILSTGDNGPQTCVLLTLLDDFRKEEGEKTSLVEKLLSFGNDRVVEEKLDEVLMLVDAINNTPAAAMKGMTASAVSHHIFYTNKIEFCSTKTAGDTEELILSTKVPTDRKGKLVMSMWKLLKETYRPPSLCTVEKTLFDPDQLVHWLQVLSMTPKTDYRMAGCFSSPLSEDPDSPVHVYPHHGIIASAIRTPVAILCRCNSTSTDRTTQRT